MIKSETLANLLRKPVTIEVWESHLISGDNYRYIVRGDEKNWKVTYRFVNKLLTQGFRVEWVLSPFNVYTIEDYNKSTSFPADSFLIEMSDDREGSSNNSSLLRIASDLKIKMAKIDFSTEIKTLRLNRPVVGLFANAGSPFPFVPILADLGIEHIPLSVDDINDGGLRNVNVFVIPGGGDYGPPFQGKILGKTGRKKVRDFVSIGGGVWGSCAGCCNLLVTHSSATNSTVSSSREEWHKVESLELICGEYWSSPDLSGVGRLVVENVRRDHPVMLGLPRQFEMVWHLGPLLKVTNEPLAGATKPEELVRPVRITRNWTPAEFMNSTRKFSRLELQSTYVGRGIVEKRPGVLLGNFGKGTVCACGGHPEFGMDVLLENQGIASKMFVNFVLLASSSSPNPEATRPLQRQTIYRRLRESESTIRSQLNNLQYQIEQLTQLSKRNPNPEWLNSSRAASTFGKTAREKWPIILKRLSKLPSEIETESRQFFRNQKLLQSKLRSISSKKQISELKSHLERIEECLSYSIDQDKADYGYQGVLPLLRSARAKMIKARAAYDKHSSPDPYPLIWDFYLGALYDLINARLMMKARNDLIELFL